jgi:hypothetical protein
MMAPVTQEHASLTTVGSGCVDKPINKVTAILIVNKAVALETKM